MLKTLKKTSKVLDVRKLAESTSVVRFERKGFQFEPGQYIRVGIEGNPDIRDYSVYSGVEDDFLEVLVRRVEEGRVSRQLCDLEPGGEVGVGGPYGHFKLLEKVRKKPLLFVSTGTGISPFHCFVDSYSGLDYRLLHGTGLAAETYEAAHYGDRYFHCVSREDGGDFRGRVTEHLRLLGIEPETNAFLCGNCNMIYEAFDLLQEKGLPTAQIHTEVYF